MQKNTAAAKAIRTFILALAGFAGTWATVDWFTNWKAGAAIVGVNLVTALLAGTVAYFQALSSMAATTPLGKAIASFAQVAGPGLATVAVTELSQVALIHAGRGVVTTLVGALFAGIATFLQNSAEDSPEPATT